MRKITLLISILAALVLLPVVAGAQSTRRTEHIAITAVGAEETQTSALIVKPMGAKGVLAWIEITAGAVLLLDINMGLYSPTVDVYQTNYASDCPSAGGGTGIGRLQCLFYPLAADDTPIGVKRIPLPNLFNLIVVHGNATAATYVLYYQWIWD